MLQFRKLEMKKWFPKEEREEELVKEQKREVKEKIMEAAIEEFNKKGLKFTMDDVAKNLSMSKKTLYTVFSDKEELFFDMVDYCFDAIKQSEQEILKDESMDIVEKIRRIVIVLPDRYQNIDLRKIYSLKEKYPEIYKKLEVRLENDWEPTILLLEKAIKEGRIKPVSLPILKTMVEGSIEMFLSRDVLLENGMEYREALDKMMNILMDGIVVNRNEGNR